VTLSAADIEADAGVEGNARLTALNGMVLLVLLAVEGFTVLGVRQMITLHVYLGVLLLGPVLLKCASTMYRFARYYLGATPYVRRGPPHIAMRILGPVVILASLAVIGTGIGLIYTGPSHREPLLTLHQGSFIVWVAAMSIHVLGHVVEASRQTWHELRDRSAPSVIRARRWRSVAVALSLVGGVGLATALLPSAHAWTTGNFERFDHIRRSH